MLPFNFPGKTIDLFNLVQSDARDGYVQNPGIDLPLPGLYRCDNSVDHDKKILAAASEGLHNSFHRFLGTVDLSPAA